MIGIGELSAKPTAQVFLCRDAAIYERARGLFPTCVCLQWQDDDDRSVFEGRRVCCLDPLGELWDEAQQGYAVRVTLITAAIPPDLTPDNAVTWASQNQTVKWPLPESEARASASDAVTPVSADAATSLGAPVALDPIESTQREPGTAKAGGVPIPQSITGDVVPSNPDCVDPIESAPPDTLKAAPSQEGAGQAGAGPTVDDLFALPDFSFCEVWRQLSDSQRSAVGGQGFDRYRSLTAYVGSSLNRAAFEKATNDALETGLDDEPPEDMPEGHPCADTPPEGLESRPINGEDRAEPSRIWTSQAEEWGTPVDPFDINAPPIVLDTSDLPAWLHMLCADEAALKGTDPGVHAMTKFGCLAAWCHESWRLQIKQLDTTWKEACRLWTFTYGHSSDGKTIALNMAAKAAVDLDTLAGRQGAVAMAKWHSDKRIRDHQITDYEKRAAKNDLKPGEQMPEPVDAPEIDKKRFTDANIEGLRTMLALTPKGWLHTDELAAWISGMGRYTSGKNSDGQERSIWMQSWDGGAFDALRAAGNISIPSLSICITACLTDSALVAALGSGRLSEEGLVQRFIVYKCRDQIRDEDHELNEEAADSFARCLANLRRMRPINDKPLRLAPAAYVEFQRFEDDVKALANSDIHSAGLKSSLLKFRSHCPRLALTLHIAMRAAAEQECCEAEYVDDAMITAIGICRQLLDHTIYFWEVTLGDGRELDRDIVQLCEAIAAQYIDFENISLSQLANSCKWWKKKTPTEKARLLATLADMNWLGRNPAAMQQSPGVMTSYKKHPAIRGLFNEHQTVIDARIRRAATGAKFAAMRQQS